MSEPIVLNNRYLLEERIGSGGMAMVFRAQDQMLERTVAVKTLRKDFSDDPEFRERFSQEAKSAANLSHPNIVTVHDFGLDSGRLFIVMENVPGSDLKSLLRKRGRFNVEEAINLMSQACAGIGYAHRAGVVHCDVKPQNILVTPDKRLKVVDFGIARALSTITPDEQAEVVWGSPNYFSPEQASGSAPSPASDVYSLGVVMYEMLAGQLPFKADTSQELARLHREALPPPLRKYNPNIPNSLENIVLKSLSKDPTARYRTAGQLGRELVSFHQQGHKQDIIPSSQLGGTSSYPPTGMTSSQTVLVTDQSDESAITSSNHEQHIRQPASLLDDAQIQLDSRLNFDWTIWILGILVLIALGGLIPFWLWVYYSLNPPLGG